MLANIIELYTALIVLNNPFAALGYFVENTAHYSSSDQRKTARLTSVSVFACMLTVGLLGRPLLQMLGINIGSFQIAGGILLFLIAMSMMGGNDNPVKPSLSDTNEPSAANKFAFVVVPMATPIIVGPGGVSTVIIYSSYVHSWRGGFSLLLAGVLVAVTCYFSLIAAARISRLLGETGIKIVNRVLGLLLAALAVQIILGGVKTLFPNLVIHLSAGVMK